MIRTGVVTRSFPGWTNLQTAEFMKEHGFPTTELCLVASDSKYWAYNGVSNISDLTDERFAEICDTYRSRGIEIVSLGVFTNLIERDDMKRFATLNYFKRHIELAGKNGIPYVSTECGYNPDHRGVITATYETDIEIVKRSMRELLEECDKWNVCIAWENCSIDLVPSAKRVHDLIKQIDHPRLKVLLDPANFIANSSEEDMFHYLSDRIAYFHGKDRRVNDVGSRLVGDGEIDWVKFLSLYHRHNDGLPFMIEFVTPQNACEIRDRVTAYDELACKAPL